MMEDVQTFSSLNYYNAEEFMKLKKNTCFKGFVVDKHDDMWGETFNAVNKLTEANVYPDYSYYQIIINYTANGNVP